MGFLRAERRPHSLRSPASLAESLADSAEPPWLFCAGASSHSLFPMTTDDLWTCSEFGGEEVVVRQEHSGRMVTTFFSLKALPTGKRPLRVPEEKGNSREKSRLEQCFQASVWGDLRVVVSKRVPGGGGGERSSGAGSPRRGGGSPARCVAGGFNAEPMRW